jgi:hypothetical protein
MGFEKYTSVSLPLSFTNNIIKKGMTGDDVYKLSCCLMGLGFLKKEALVNDVFDETTEQAVKKAQFILNVHIDGEVGSETKKELEEALERVRKTNIIEPSSTAKIFNGQQFANFANSVLSKETFWNPDLPFIQPFIENMPGSFSHSYWPWCSATVYWILNEFLFKPNGKNMPLVYPKYPQTFAWVETFQQYFKNKGWYHQNKTSFTPTNGAIVIFDWGSSSQPTGEFDITDKYPDDHIGILLEVKKNGNNEVFVCAEGNTGNNPGKTGIKNRPRAFIQGFGIIPDGTKPSEMFS